MRNVKEYRQEKDLGGALAFHFCGWEKCEPGHSFGPAVRPHYLFHLILSGRGCYERMGVRYELGAGQGFLILPGESTWYQADRKEPWEYCWIGFGGTEAEGILKECGLDSENVIYDDRSGGLLRREMMQLVDSFGHAHTNHYMQLGRLYLSLSHMVQPVRGAVYQDYVSKALDFIQNNFSYEIGVAEIARTVGIDRTYLYRVFKEQVGQSPKGYLTAFRLRMAAQMLAETDLTVTEVAVSCGWKEASLLDRQFKENYGCTPLQYRKKHVATECRSRNAMIPKLGERA